MNLIKAAITATIVGAVSIAAAPKAEAAFIQCTPSQDTVVNEAAATSAVFTCSPGAGSAPGGIDDNLAGDGLLVNSIQLQVTGTFQENNGTPGASFSVRYFTNNLLSPAFGVVECTANAIVGAPPASNPNQALGACTANSSVLAVAPIDVIGAFLVTVNGGPGSTPLPFNASASVYYQVTTQQTTVPEPTSLALFSLATLGAGFARRRRQ